MGIPVDEPLAAKDVTVAEPIEEGHAHGAGAAFVKREARACPIARTAKFAKLAEDALLVLVFPLPDPLDEFVAAQVVAGLLFLLKDEALNDRLCGDASVVGAGHPLGIVALHAPPADQHVLQRVIQRVPHVQRAGDVRRRDDDRIRLALRIGPAVCIAALVPELQPFLLGFARIVRFGEFRRHGNPYLCSESLNSLYSIESTSASHDASIMFSLTPTVPHTSEPSRDSITTRTRAAVPARAFTTRTL